MKKLIFAAAMALCAAAGAADKKDVYDIKPEAAKAVEAPSSVEWENANNAALASATDESVVSAYVADGVKAASLLALVKPAYRTDPLVACQVAAVTQYVMRKDPWYWLCFDGPRARGRKVWVRALASRIRSTGDDYIKSFCLDQLRWCASADDVPAIAGIAANASSKAVKELAEMVVRELEGKSVGLK